MQLSLFGLRSTENCASLSLHLLLLSKDNFTVTLFISDHPSLRYFNIEGDPLVVAHSWKRLIIMRLKRLDFQGPWLDEDSFRLLAASMLLENIVEALVDFHLKLLSLIHLSTSVKVLESLGMAS